MFATFFIYTMCTIKQPVKFIPLYYSVEKGKDGLFKKRC